MKKTLLYMLLALVFVVTGCRNSSKREFNHLLLELADGDLVIDHHDWVTIADYLDHQKAHFREFYKDDQLDAKAVKEYISDFFAHRRPPKTISFVGIGEELKFHIYLERSGSMKPYDSPNGDGSFRAAVMALQNSLPVKSSVDSIGEQGYTDFRQIFDNILNKTTDRDVSILVTDLIYSTRDMQGVNPQKVFNEAQEMINAVFKDEVKRKAMLVVRMMGSYNGPYYAYDNSVHAYNGRRPYYIIIVGSNDAIAQLTNDAQFRTFANMSDMQGYDNMCLFAAKPIYHPYCSFLLQNDNIRGKFRVAHGQDNQITRLTDVTPDKDSGDLQLALAVDLSKMFIDERYLTDPQNYQVDADDEFKIKEIRKLSDKDLTQKEKKYVASATHLFILSAKEVHHSDEVEIRLLNRLPDWVSAASTDNDLVPNATTTFALRYLLNGIYDSYKRNADDEPAYFELTLHLED